MQGIVFCEFVDFVELVAGEEIVDQMILDANVPSGGGYTSVGQYDFQELAQLIGALSKLTNTPSPELIKIFGKHLFGRLNAHYPHFVSGAPDMLSFLESIETYIHVEVRKLYPNAELPNIETRRVNENTLELNYRSCRPLGQLCIGLIEGCAEFFEVELDIETAVADEGLDIIIKMLSKSDTTQAA